MDQFPISAFVGGSALGIGFSMLLFSILFAYWRLCRKNKLKNKKIVEPPKPKAEEKPLFFKASDPELDSLQIDMKPVPSVVQLEKSINPTVGDLKDEIDSERRKVGEMTKKAGLLLLEVETLRDQVANFELLVEQLQMELEGTQTTANSLVEENTLLKSDLQDATTDIESLVKHLDPKAQKNFNKVNRASSDMSSSVESMDMKFKKRTRVVQEILETEETYVNSLHVIRDQFYNPLETMISNDDHKSIFLGIKEIIPIHEQLLSELRKRVSNWTKDQCIGDIFMLIINKLKLYTRYSNNYDKSLATVAKLMKTNTEFSQFIQRQARRSNGSDLSSYLIQPIQRIPRYVLLLDEVVKVTPSSHQDYQDLFIALNKIKEVATFINDQKRMTETLEKMVEVQSKLITRPNEPGLLKPGRFFLMEGSLLHISKRGIKQTYNFLFSDLFIIAKKTNLLKAESFRGTIMGTRKYQKSRTTHSSSILVSPLEGNYKEVLRFSISPHTILLKNPNLLEYKKELHLPDNVSNLTCTFGLVAGDEIILFGCGDIIIKDRWLHKLSDAIEALKLQHNQNEIARVREGHIEAAKKRVSESDMSHRSYLSSSSDPLIVLSQDNIQEQDKDTDTSNLKNLTVESPNEPEKEEKNTSETVVESSDDHMTSPNS